VEFTIPTQAIDQDEKANYVIEELHHALDLSSSVIYPHWNIQGDGWNQVAVVNSNSRRSVDIYKSSTHIQTLLIAMWDKNDQKLLIHIRAQENVVGYVLLPMIQQFLEGDRQEVKDGLNPLLQISPAIN
jgi:hypothetical protein